MRTVMAAVLVVLVVAAVLLAWAQQRRLMYFPFAEVPAPAEVGLESVEEVRFRTSDGLELAGWFVRAMELPPKGGSHWEAGSDREAGSDKEGGGGADRKPAVLVFNGNGGNRAYRAPLASALRRAGVHVLLFDYRGYGGNPGDPSEGGLAMDGRAARVYLVTRPDVDSSRLVYFGESLGAAVAVELAGQQPPAALILRSPFTSMVAIGQYHYPFLPVRWLLRDRFDAIGRIRQVHAPILVIAGDRDGIVPIEHSRRVYEAAAEPKRLRVIAGADHNDAALLAGAEMIEEVLGFLSASI
jgi:fermentation-respiration switch protein FrsA (DUF1100 family)